MKTPAQVLREAAALVEKGHCKGEYARDAQGLKVDRDSPSAVSWCAFGAIARANGTLLNDQAVACESALEAVVEDDVQEWNDAPERTAAEVAEAMRKAAESLENHQ